MKQTVAAQGKLYVWGKGYPAFKELAKDVKKVATGENHCIFIACIFLSDKANQEVFGIGSNKFGQLGLTENNN